MLEKETKSCRPCEGYGLAWKFGPENCPLCHGKARIPIDPRRTLRCEPCRGSGRLRRFEKVLCDVCGGYGAIDPNLPPPDTGSMVWFVEGGKPYTERKRLAAVLETLSGEVCVCDPYFGPGVLTAIERLQQCKGVRCLTRDLGPGGKATAEQQVKDFKIEHPHVKFGFINNGDLHDRYVLTDSNLLLLGHGLKDFGKKETFVVILDQEYAEDTINTVKNTFDAHWKDALPLG